MSVHIMGLIWNCELEQNVKYILLAYADHADHEGRSIYPSDALVAWKTGYSERQVIRIRLALIEKKIMLRDGTSPFRTQMYRIDVDALPKRDAFQGPKRGRPATKTDPESTELPENGQNIGDMVSPIYEKTGDNLTPILEKEVTSWHPAGDIPTKQVTSETKTGDIAMSLNPSLTTRFKPPDLTNGGVLLELIAGSHYSPKTAWDAASRQLQAEMPKSAFESYVRFTEAFDFHNGVFYVLCQNAYARDWMRSRVKSTVTRMLVGICNQTVEVIFLAPEDLEVQANMSQTVECATL